jgi:23S rRNA pseudouridine1911/1915/1917 synthase
VAELRRHVVTADEAGLRLDVLLASLVRRSRAHAQRLIERGRVEVDGHPVRKRHEVRAGELVAWEPLPPETGSLSPSSIVVPMVYEDDWLVVVDKPAGLVVHPAPGHEDDTLVNALLDKGIAGGHGRRPGIVHRLDKDTSGLLIVARSEVAYRRLVAALGARTVQRTYLALVHGEPRQQQAEIDAPIGRHVRDRQRMSVHTTAGRRAVTHFSVLGQARGFALLEVRLETGRTHQIRVHLAALGHPVAGDATYGRRPRPEGLDRQFLHAWRLRFAHPADGREIAVSASLPPDLAAFLDTLGLADPSATP